VFLLLNLCVLDFKLVIPTPCKYLGDVNERLTSNVKLFCLSCQE
jgi:hypothetical protein